MSQKIPWNEDEALILLDALLQVLSGVSSRKDAVASVSRELRMRAIHQGATIDDIFRNQNGIRLQMSVMECAYTNGEQGLNHHKVPKLFQNVVSLHKNDKNTYEKRLAEAKSTIGSEKTIQSYFFEWLAEEVPSEQADELYTVLHTICSDIEQFCAQEGTLKGPLFETTDLGLVRHVLCVAEANEKVHFEEGRKTSKLYSVLYLYYKFLKEPSGTIRTQITHTDSQFHPASKPLETPHFGETLDGPLQVDFNCIGDMAYTYPLALEYAGRKTEYHKWGKLYVALISELRSKYREKFTNKKDRIVSRSNTAMIASEDMKTNLRMPKFIGEGLYIEGNCSATQIVNNIRLFLELCNVDFSAVIIQYARKDHHTALVDNQGDSEHPDRLQPQFDAELLSAAETILSTYFVNGMRKHAAIAKKKFRKSYLDLTGEPLPESVDIDELSSAVGIEYADKFYVVAEENKEKIRELISAAVDAGNRVMFYKEIYECHPDFMTKAGIFSTDLLKSVLKQILPDMRYKRTFFSLEDDDSLEKDIINCYGDAPIRSYREIKERLCYADLSQIRLVCSRSSKFVWAKDETYALTERVILSQSDVDNSLDIISRDIEKQGFSVVQRISISESAEWNPNIPEAAVREAMYIKHLAPLYQRNRSIITLSGASFSAPMIMIEHCKSLQEVTLSELQTYEEGLTDKSAYSLSAAYDTMIRVDREHFVSLDAIKFDVRAIDNALSLFVQDNIVPLGSVKSFTSFPEVDGYSWNLFLLDSFCRHKSMRFRTMGGPAKSKPVGAIFPIQMKFDNYDALLAQVAAESGLALHADDMGEFFTKNAYTLRRIDTSGIVNKAQEIRIQEGIANV